MTLFKRGKYYWTTFYIEKKKYFFSTKTGIRSEAKSFEATKYQQVLSSLNNQIGIGKSWKEAETRWLEEKKSKRTLYQDIEKFKYLDPILCDTYLKDIDANLIESIAKDKESGGVTPATINRLLALIKSIMICARDRWEWLDKVPYIRFRQELKYRDRWLTESEAITLAKNLPPHLVAPFYFTLYTGLRAANVYELKWAQIDLTPGSEYLYVKADDFKNNTHYRLPLNNNAVKILTTQKGKNNEYVFTYRNKPVKVFSTKSWRAALKKSNIENFRWHDLRHTWATWFLINGGTLHELMGLGGWKDIKSVMKYAHWANEYLRKATNRANINCILNEQML